MAIFHAAHHVALFLDKTPILAKRFRWRLTKFRQMLENWVNPGKFRPTGINTQVLAEHGSR
ncbi:hypothetical protein [Martelella sp. AMO21009]